MWPLVIGNFPDPVNVMRETAAGPSFWRQRLAPGQTGLPSSPGNSRVVTGEIYCRYMPGLVLSHALSMAAILPICYTYAGLGGRYLFYGCVHRMDRDEPNRVVKGCLLAVGSFEWESRKHATCRS